MDYETAVTNLEKLIEWSRTNSVDLTRNEAATRFHLIDHILSDCLGWPPEQVEPERYQNGEYSDYELGLPAKKLVLEAKREGIYFELPLGFNKNKCKIHTLYEDNKDIQAAIKQAMAYCQARGIPFGAVSNGHQFIAFISNRQDGIPPEEGLAIVFDSLDSIRARFKEFWNMFSPFGLESGQINLSLSDITPTPPPEKLSSRLVDYPGYKNRNPVAAELQILGGLFLEDITKQPDIEEEFVRETYCESGALSQYTLISKEMLNSRYTSYFEKETKVTVKPVRTKKGIQPELRNDLLAANISRRPIILVGDVGVGKSMFIRRLILVDAKDVLDKAIVLYLNFGNRPALVTEISSYVLSELEQQLKDEYSIDIQERNFVRGVYHSELQRFAKGIYSDLAESSPEMFRKKEIEHLHKLMLNQEQHLRACLFHIVSGQKKQILSSSI